MLKQRNLKSMEDGQVCSKLVQEHVINSKEFRSAKVVGAYFAIGSEVKTSIIIEQAKSLGKRVALPRVGADNNIISFHELLSEKNLIKGSFGIMEPLPSCQVVDRIGLLIVPGIAFDKNGYRLGYGKGYYDRYLSENKPEFSFGLSYKFQLIENLPHDTHDKKMDAIATEDGILYI